MTGTSTTLGTGSYLLAVLLIVSWLLGTGSLVEGEPEPISSELLYNSESFLSDAENLILLNKLRQMSEEKKDITEREMLIQSVLDARARAWSQQFHGEYSAEDLPAANTLINSPQHPGKRTAVSYLTLCHFKICNMGRKRQLTK